MHRRLGCATLSQLAFPGEGNPNFPKEKSHWDITDVKIKKKEKKYTPTLYMPQERRLHISAKSNKLIINIGICLNRRHPYSL